LNGVTALILRFSPNSIALLANYVTVVEDRHNVRKILSPSSSLPLLDKPNPPCSAVSLRQLIATCTKRRTQNVERCGTLLVHVVDLDVRRQRLQTHCYSAKYRPAYNDFAARRN